MNRRPDEDGRYPLSTKEYEALRTIFGALNSLTTDALRERMTLIEGGEEDLAKARELIRGVMNGLLATIPLNKLTAISRELKHTVCELRIKPPVPAKENGFVYVDQAALVRLADRAIQMDCVLCEKGIREGRRCPLYKAMNDCFPYDLDGPEDALCPFAGVSTVKMEG